MPDTSGDDGGQGRPRTLTNPPAASAFAMTNLAERAPIVLLFH